MALLGILNADWERVIGSSESPTPPEKRVVKSDTLGVFIRTTVFGFTKEDTTVDQRDFQRIEIPAEEIDRETAKAGKPQVPYVRLLIAIPDSCELNITVDPSDYILLKDYLVYPIPWVVYEDSGGCIYYTEVFTYDTSFYQEDTLYPGILYEVQSDGYWRDQRVLEVFLYPVQFNPQQRLMYVYSGIDVMIEYTGTVVENERGLGPFEDMGRDILLNYPGIDRAVPPHEPAVHYYTNLDTSNIADYIIVTHVDFLDEGVAQYWIDQFAQWRVEHNQFDVGIVTMSAVYKEFLESAQGDSARALRDFLIYAYEHWVAPSMPDSHFAYCLFIGDWDYVPTKLYTYFYDTEQWLGAREGYFRNLNGGWGEDIMLGRWPVKETNVQDLVTIAQKTINYEKYPDTTGDWRRRGLLIAGDGTGMEDFDKAITASKPYFTDINYDTLVTRYSHINNDSLFREAIQSNLNIGDIVTLYVDHGAPGNWWARYDTSWVKQLHNGDSLPVVLSDACFTAMFQWDHPFYDATHSYPAGVSFGEHFLINQNGGAVAFYGATGPGAGGLRSVLNQILRYQNWILGKSLINLNAPIYCLLGDPALDLGDYTAYPNLPDLVIRPRGLDITLLAPYPYPASGDSMPIRAKVLNIGGTAAQDVTVKFEIVCEEALIYSDSVTIDTIQPRDSAIAIVYWDTESTHPNYYGEIGDCEFWVKADPHSEIEESWAYNNTSLVTKKVALYPHQPGWPRQVSDFSQPAIANLDASGSVEIVYTVQDSIYVFDKDGNVVTPWPHYFEKVHGMVLGDINNNDSIDIIVISCDSIKVYDCQGNILPGWPKKIPVSDYKFAGLPALGSIDDVDFTEIVILAKPTEISGEKDSIKTFVYSYNGFLQHEFISSFRLGASVEEEIILAGASIENVMGDDNDEIVLSYGTEHSRFYTEIFDKDGSQAVLEYGSNRVISALADLNNDDTTDVITGCYDSNIRAYDAAHNQSLWARATEGPINSSPAIGDIHPVEEGVEVTFGNDAGRIHLRRGINGDNISPWPYVIIPSTAVKISPAIADVNRDQNLDIIIGADNGYIYGFNFDKTFITSPFPLPLFGKPSSPIIGDVDGDEKSEIILSSSDGYLHIWENRDSRVENYLLEWPQFHHDYQRTGLYGW
jgi:hypothetical protein